MLADVNPQAVAALRETVRLNGLEDRVTVYESDGLDDIPAQERWDLVVSNPPHFDEQGGPAPQPAAARSRLGLHRGFYAQVGEHLAPGGSLLIQENSEGSGTGGLPSDDRGQRAHPRAHRLVHRAAARSRSSTTCG